MIGTGNMQDTGSPTQRRSLPETGWREWLLWLVQRRQRVRVDGFSMLPTLGAGEVVLVDRRAYVRTPPKAGDIVVARHPYQRGTLLVKRISSVSEDGRCHLRSDNPDEGTDSRAFGAVSPEQIVGRVSSRVPRPM